MFPRQPLLDSNNAGLEEHPIKTWISDYLTDNSMHVVTNGASSSTVLVISGAPQGSYQCSALIVSDGNMVLYADDMLLCQPIW